MLDERPVCPVCDTTDCVAPGHRPLARLNFSEWSEEHERAQRTAAARQRRGVDPMAENESTYTVDENYYEERPLPGSTKRTTRVLKYRAGQTISKAEAEEAGLTGSSSKKGSSKKGSSGKSKKGSSGKAKKATSDKAKKSSSDK